MRQLTLNFTTGEISVLEVPTPKIQKGCLLIRTRCSLISSGTERTIYNFSKSNILEKAKNQPDRVKEVLDKIKSDGLFTTYESVINKLDSSIPIGNSNVGEVIGIGKGVNGFKIGDRVVSNGPHSEIVSVPHNLCARIPDCVNDEEAAFTVLGSIALQGIRLSNPTFGETFLVSGLGLIGLLAVQILKANGCTVLGIDPKEKKCKLAEALGAQAFQLDEYVDPLPWILGNTDNLGIDGAIITASTKSNEPVNLAAKACRKRGRIILVGVTGLDLRRDLFYKKEINFQVSCSYGPGRYDNVYEKEGKDYPLGFVRWTEKRNFKSVLQAIENKSIKLESLISHKIDFLNSSKAFEILNSNKSLFGILLLYKKDEIKMDNSILLSEKQSNKIKYKSKNAVVNFIGAGNYASRVLIPSLKKLNVKLDKLSSNNGLDASLIGRKYNFSEITTNSYKLLNDKDSNIIFIASRHDSHAEYVIESIKRNKNIFVEKPLCLNISELNKIKKTYIDRKENNNGIPPILMIGFNRRFAPLTKKFKNIIDKFTSPKAFIYTINAGSIPRENWIHNPEIGGGRLIGEACHFVDMLRFLTGSRIKNLNISKSKSNLDICDTFCMNLEFESGDVGNINYFSNGSKSFPKERIEVFSNNSVVILDNFKRIKCWGINIRFNKRLFIQNKGNLDCVREFIEAVKKGKESPIPIEEIFEVHELLLGTQKK